jgi:hypothetical protein
VQGIETQRLEGKLDDETSGSAGFSEIKKRELLLLRDKPVFLDPQLLDFRVQRRAAMSASRDSTSFSGGSSGPLIQEETNCIRLFFSSRRVVHDRGACC